MTGEQTASSVAPGRVRLARLDGLRGLAALGVCLHHLAFFCGDRAPDLPIGLGWPVHWVFERGWALVDLFFVLSGYVFAHVYGAPGQLRKAGAMGDFWVARVARLWPLHLVTLALTALFAWGGSNDAWHLLLNVVMLQGFDLGVPLGFNIVSWSLTMEMTAYALFALGCWVGDRALLWIAVLAVVGSAWWLALVGHPDGPWHGEVIARGLLGFFTGQILWRCRMLAARLPKVLLVVLVVSGLWLEKGDYSPLLPLGLLCWPAVLLLALRSSWLERGLAAWLGERSFGVYMVHLLVIRAVNAGVPAHICSLTWIASQIAAIVLTLAGAEAAYRLIEVPGRSALRALWADRSRGALKQLAQPA